MENQAKKKVAAYVRVSLETDRLAHSLAAQTAYYTSVIRDNPEWEPAGIYADSFISGTQTDRRADFRRLLSDCEQGRINIVLCKSISRFARNTVDLLRTVRRLRDIGVEVRFEKENISSLSPDGELMLTILAGFAQEESRSISENVKWGLRKRYSMGTAVVRNKTVLGYRFDGERYVIVEEEARLVRLIFDMYINKVPLRSISENLKTLGAKTPRGCDFSHNQIDYIVHNEIYIGDLVFQKSFVKNFITHAKVPNRGELPVYRLCSAHEPIIDRALFEKAQSEALRRSVKRPVYCFSGKLICSKCKKPFTRRSNYGKYACWHCRSCLDIKLDENKLRSLFGMTDEQFSESVSSVLVGENGSLGVTFYDGRTFSWQYE